VSFAASTAGKEYPVRQEIIGDDGAWRLPARHSMPDIRCKKQFHAAFA